MGRGLILDCLKSVLSTPEQVYCPFIKPRLSFILVMVRTAGPQDAKPGPQPEELHSWPLLAREYSMAGTQGFTYHPVQGTVKTWLTEKSGTPG